MKGKARADLSLLWGTVKTCHTPEKTQLRGSEDTLTHKLKEGLSDPIRRWHG